MADTSWVDILSKIIPVSVITAVGGYLARKFQVEGKRKQMREQLYREISNNHQTLAVCIALVTSVAGIRDGAPFRFGEKLGLNFGVWNFYHGEKRELLFDLNEAGAITRIYEKLTSVVNDDGSGYGHVRGKEALAEIDDRLLDKTLDQELYLKVSSPEARKYAEDLLTGKRPSYRKSLNPL